MNEAMHVEHMHKCVLMYSIQADWPSSAGLRLMIHDPWVNGS